MVGQTLGDYRIIETIGAGKMGVVYKAVDTCRGHLVALTILSEQLSQDPKAVERFQQEARTASAACDYGEHNGQHFIAMELAGRTAAPLASKPPLSRATRIQQVSGAVLVVAVVAILVFIVVMTLLNRCTSTQFSRGEPIALGAYRLTVSFVENASRDENMETAIFYRWVRMDPPEERRGGIRFGPKFALVDSEGNKYGPGGGMDAASYRSLAGQSDTPYNPEERVVWFTVPEGSGGLTLHMTNPETRKGQPCAAVVSLRP